MTGYVPEKGGNLARDCRGGDGLQFAPRHQLPVSSTEPDLSLPSNITYVLREMRLAILVMTADACWMAISPCRFDQGLAGPAVACLGDPALPPCLSS